MGGSGSRVALHGKRKRQQGQQQQQEDGCPICMAPLTGTMRTMLPCDHVFHTGCVQKWSGIHPACPLCRTQFDRPQLCAGCAAPAEGQDQRIEADEQQRVRAQDNRLSHQRLIRREEFVARHPLVPRGRLSRAVEGIEGADVLLGWLNAINPVLYERLESGDTAGMSRALVAAQMVNMFASSPPSRGGRNRLEELMIRGRDLMEGMSFGVISPPHRIAERLPIREFVDAIAPTLPMTIPADQAARLERTRPSIEEHFIQQQTRLGHPLR